MKFLPLDIKVSLNNVLILLVFFSALKGSLLAFSLFQEILPNNSKTEKIQHNIKKQEPILKKNPISPSVFQVKDAQAAETNSDIIPRPVDKLLAKQWERLRVKEAELKRKEQMLKELKKDIDKKLKEEQKLAQKLEGLINKAEVLKNKKIKHLVDVYSNMDPARAAKVLETLDKDLAVKILAGMRGRVAGEILTNMDPKKAADLSEALTAFQTPFGK